MKNVLFSYVTCFFLYLLCFENTFAAVTWSEAQPGGAADYSWTPSAMSSDGQKMIVGNQWGFLYVSSNKGGNWDLVDPTGTAEEHNWLTTSMSSNGQIILAGVYGGRLYRSTNGGNNWSEIRPAGNADFDWSTTSMSSDGQIMMAGIRGSGRLYKSTNGGDNWNEIRPAGDTDQSWASSNMSSNGQVMVAGVLNGRLYLSINFGSNWSEIQPAGEGDEQWYSTGMSSSGQVILVGNGNSLFISTNTGNNWTEVLPAGEVDKTWGISSISSNGETLFIGNSERLYFSTDGGDTWSQTQPAGDVNKNWTLGNMSADSRVMLAGVYEGRLYLGLNPSTTSSQSSSGTSDSSSTPTCATTPSGAPDLFQINTTAQTATLLFAPVGQANNYVVSYGFSSNANQFAVMTNQGSSTGVLSYTINALPNNATMYFKVYAQNNCGQGNWSNIMQVKTWGGVFYKNVIREVISKIITQKATTLNKETKPSSVSSKVSSHKSLDKVEKLNNANQKSPNPAYDIKKSCILFICW